MVHEDASTPLVTVNMLYKVGSRDEREELTGFAHLFEHLMFGGTRAVPDYDREVDLMGGESNAFTNTDITNYFLTVPAEHLEHALELEADRMKGDWNIENDQWNVLDVQKRVVTEEYHQRYENQPYGDVWMLLRPLCYRVHPYRWCTIGADIKHVQEATLEDVRGFFDRFYRPDNAIMAIAGHVRESDALAMVQRLFVVDTSNRPALEHCKVVEPDQTEARRLLVERDVPNSAIYKAYVMCDRHDEDYYVFDMISDILSNGHSSRMYNHLIKEQGLFTEVNAYITGEEGQGLFVMSGKLREGVTFEQAERALDAEVERIKAEPVSDHEIEKVANKFENTFVYSHYKAADRAQCLCYYESLGDVELVNDEPQHYRTITPDRIRQVACRYFVPEHACVLLYKAKAHSADV